MISQEQKEELKANVGLVAEEFDEIDPNWVNRIDLEKLVMDSPKKCICGQLGWQNKFVGVPFELFEYNSPEETLETDVFLSGIGPRYPEKRAEILKEVWTDEVSKRQS